jgi:leader peptidase (prepilin peptidase)/N-methyltransferase
MDPLLIVVFVFGLLVGSFLNVCIYRLPRHESIVWPASHCPTCAQPIATYDNIPVLGFLWLGGRCRRCQQPISLRYPLVELVNALGSLFIVWHFGWTPAAAVYAALFSSLIVITGTDLTHTIIPDAVTLPGILIGLVSATTVLPVGLMNSLLGIFVGGGVLWMLAWISPYLFGKEGMGGGDIKLLAMVGAFLGWRPVLLTMMVGALVGSIVGLSLIGLKVLRRDQYIPFGPFLALGALVSLFFHQRLFDWYWGLLGPP